MAKPRIFISSTFYDLKQVRADIDFFINQMGYEAVRNEEGDIPYGREEAIEEYCYKEIKNVDILVCIIGGRFGSEAKNNAKASVTQMELKTARKENKQVYIFVESNILTEFETYMLNKDADITYKFVDDIRIYEFIEEVKSLGNNNIIKGFETASEIVRFLKEQMAGLFEHLLERETRVKEIGLIKGLENTAQTLNKLVNFLSAQNSGHAEEINKILMINHPLVDEVKRRLNVPYNFYFEGLEDLINLFNARSYNYGELVTFTNGAKYYEFSKMQIKRRSYFTYQANCLSKI